MAFATVADLIDRFDEPLLKDLASDDGTPVSDLTDNSRVATALEGASGEVVVACEVGQLYSADDLSAIEGHARVLLADIVCGLALGRLIRRRPQRPDVASQWKQAMDDSQAYLDRFRRGERVFPLPAQQAASVPAVSGPEALQIPLLNNVTYRCSGYYPDPAIRLPRRF